MICLTEKDDAVIFNVRVVPRASKSEIVGELGGALKIRISAAPVDGTANSELIKFLARKFNISKSSVEIIAGQTSRIKQVKIYELTREKLSAILRGEN